MKLNRRTRHAIVICSLLCLTPMTALAAGCVLHNKSTLRIYGATDLVIKQNTPIGEKVAATSDTGDNSIIVSCIGLTNVMANYTGMTESEIPGVYRTALPGLGVKFEWETPSGTRALPYTTSIDNPARYNIRNRDTLRASFYRIAGDFTGGVLAAGGREDVGEMRFDAIQGIVFQFDNIPFRLATCSVTAASLNQTVPMGVHTLKDFDGAGNAPWHGFSIESETCDLTQFSQAHFTFSGTTPVGRPDLFAVNNITGAATGIGLGLRVENGADIIPGAVLDMPTVAAGARYAFQARYQKLGGPVTSGSANATVIVNVEYD